MHKDVKPIEAAYRAAVREAVEAKRKLEENPPPPRRTPSHRERLAAAEQLISKIANPDPRAKVRRLERSAGIIGKALGVTPEEAAAIEDEIKDQLAAEKAKATSKTEE
jgi:hypothetical protein